MIRKIADRLLGTGQKRALKRVVNSGRRHISQTLKSYEKADLVEALRGLGLQAGDTVMVHANFPADTGFQGAPADMVEALLDAVGDSGNLLMMSIPFRGSAYDYLEKDKLFDAAKTVSMVGLVTEMFRRRPGTLRSLHPTHPVLAHGPDAATMVAHHESTVYPCGRGSPFDDLRERQGKLLFVDVSFGAITFFHHLEDLFKDKLSVPVYEERLFEARVRDADGREHIVPTLAFNRQAARNTDILEEELGNAGALAQGKIGSTSLLLVGCESVVNAMSTLIDRGDQPVTVAEQGKA